MHRVMGKLGFIAATLGLLVASAGSQAFAEQGTLQIWINSDKGYNGLQKVGDEFGKKNGVKVVVEHPQDAPSKFQTQAAAAQGPDVFIWAHDRAGEWQVGGLLTEVKPSAKFKRQFVNTGWDAFTIGGKVWGYPISVEAVGLVCNKDVVKAPPRSFEAFIPLHKKLAKKGKKALMWDYNNTYFTWPLLAAGGGYPFKRKPNGSYDESNIGVANKGALAGLRMVVRLIDEGVMPKGAKYADMESAMVKGELGCMINGPWSWDNLRKNKINFGVYPIPTVAGKKSRAFVGVQGAMINAASKNKELAVEFIENYMLTKQGLQTINDDVPLGVPAHKAFYKTLAKDALIRATMANAKAGLPMPNTPAMGRFWSAMASALENATNGRQKPKDALAGALKRIQK